MAVLRACDDDDDDDNNSERITFYHLTSSEPRVRPPSGPPQIKMKKKTP